MLPAFSGADVVLSRWWLFLVVAAGCVGGADEKDADPRAPRDTDADTDADSDTDTDADTDTDTDADTDVPCAAGVIVCDGATARVCDGSGGWSSETVCAELCVEDIGCAVCEPDDRRCADGASERCASDGQAWEIVEVCDADVGLSCDEASGTCAGACAAAELGTTSIGCDFRVVQGPNMMVYAYDMEVGVTNVGTAPTEVIFEKDGAELDRMTLAAGASGSVELGYFDDMPNEQGPSQTYPGLAVRVRADQPLQVVQIYGDSTSADSSLLHPVHTWGTRALVASYEGYGGYVPANFAVTPASDAATLVVTPSSGAGTALAGGGLDATGAGRVTLDDGDVFIAYFSNPSDPTGTLVEGDAPFQLIGGSEGADVPDLMASYADHLEDVSPDIGVLGTTYVAVPPWTLDDTASGVRWRVVAAEAGTSVTFDPAVTRPTTLAAVGDHLDIDTDEAFVVESDKPVMVVGYAYCGWGGDWRGTEPAMLILPPVDRFLPSTRLYATEDERWEPFGVVVALVGDAVTRDGASLTTFTEVGSSGWAYARVNLAPGEATTLAAAGGVWAHAVGLDSYSSYWHAADFSLERR